MSSRLVFVDGSGDLQEHSTAQPLPVTGTISATNPSVGTDGATAPTSATEIGWIDGSGNLAGVSAANPLPVSASVSISESVASVTGSATSAAVLTNFPVNPTTGYRTASVQVTSVGSGCTLIAEQSNDGTTWYGAQTPTDLTAQSATPLTAIGLYDFPVAAKQFRVRCSVYGSGTPAVNVQFRQSGIDYALQSVTVGGTLPAFASPPGVTVTGTVTANAGTNLNTSALNLEATQAAFKAANHTDTIAITAALGSPFQAGGNIGNTTFAATQSGTWTVQPGNTANTTAWKVDGSAVTQPVSAASLPLPTGASTAAKQPALGTAGSASADVISIQGIAAMTKLLVTPDSVALPANQSVNVSQVNGTTVLVNTGAVGTGSQRVAVGTDTATVAGSAPGSAGSPNIFAGVSGSAASGASVAGNPLLSGGRAATANPTAVTDGQAVALMADKLGKLVAVGAIRILKGSQKATLSNTTSETTIVTAVASTFLDLYGLIFANSGASTTKVDVRDTTGGSIIATFEVPTLETRGFMVPVDSAIPQTTVNTNWTAQCTTATTALEVTALYVKNT